MSTNLHFEAKATPFQKELTRRVDGYFAGRSRNGGAAWFGKAAAWLCIFGALFAAVVFLHLPMWAFVLLCLARGFSVAEVGFNVGHDAIHGSASSSPGLNALFSRSYEIMGASSRMWSWAHNIVHHTYTNVPGTDHDLEPGFYLKFYSNERRGALLRFQHVYAWALYGLTVLVWTFKKDFEQLLARRPVTTWRDTLDVIAGKLFHLGLWFAVPLLFGANPWWQVLVGYVLSSFMAGLTAAVVFQLAHVVEGPEFPRPSEAGVLAGDFHAHQLRSTSNFAPRNPLATFFTGGLNHQVEHHLFPKICHTHYAALNPLVQRCAADFGLPYHEHPTFLAALASHARVLYALGRESATTPLLDEEGVAGRKLQPRSP